MLAVSVGFVNRRMVFFRCQGYPGAARRLYRRAAWALGLLCLLAMLAQELMLLLSHQLSWRTGLPLHLCSAMGVLMLPTLLTGNESLRHAALYLGVPGALAALLFPAVLSTPWPRGMALAWLAPKTHRCGAGRRGAGRTWLCGGGCQQAHRRQLSVLKYPGGRNAPDAFSPAWAGRLSSLVGAPVRGGAVYTGSGCLPVGAEEGWQEQRMNLKSTGEALRGGNT